VRLSLRNINSSFSFGRQRLVCVGFQTNVCVWIRQRYWTSVSSGRLLTRLTEGKWPLRRLRSATGIPSCRAIPPWTCVFRPPRATYFISPPLSPVATCPTAVIITSSRRTIHANRQRRQTRFYLEETHAEHTYIRRKTNLNETIIQTNFVGVSFYVDIRFPLFIPHNKYVFLYQMYSNLKCVRQWVES